MPDAEIIPIGAKSTAGRGSKTSPSAAARALAAPVPRRAKSESAEGAPATAQTSARAKARRTAASEAGDRTSTQADKPNAPVENARPVDAPPGDAPRAGDAPYEDAAHQDAPYEDAPYEDAPYEDAPSEDALRAEDVADSIADAAREVFGERAWEHRLAETLSFLRHRLTGDYHVDEFGFDAEVTERFVLTALRPIAQKWFRIDVRGIENIPVEGGALVVSNHSGAIPMDGLMTALVLHDHAHRSLRMLAADLVFTLPFVGELARKGGATLASNEDAERMLCRGDLVGVWPEGFKGIGKPFSERYKLQRFGRGGFVSAALRVQVPIIPCSVVGAEEIYPMIGNIPSLARLLGAPYVPITPFFPWLGLLGLVPLPSKWLIEFGEPIRTDAYGDGAADDPMLVFNVTDQVRETIQQTLYSLLMQRRGVFS